MSSIARLTESSPTANLLRNSRLFSVPQPLPRPVMTEVRGRISRRSDTATSYYPTHQVIGTPESSRARGDWGLKRSIPMKSSRSTKAIRVSALDTYEEVTEFESASDHAKTLEKLQELNLSITRLQRGEYGSYDFEKVNRQPSAFEPDYDNTAKVSQTIDDSLQEKLRAKLLKRWRLRGPELRHTSDVEFEEYLATEVSSKMADFAPYLRSFYTQRFAKAEVDRVHFNPESAKDQYHQWIQTMSLEQVEAYLAHHLSSWLNSPLGSEQQTSLGIKNVTSTSASTPSFEQYMAEHKLFELLTVDAVFNGGGPALSEAKMAQVSKDGHTGDRSKLLQYVDKIESQFLAKIQQEWPEYLSRFRNTSGTEDSHRHMLEYFFDLPAVVHHSKLDTAQLSTHPSAGLSYRRTAQVIHNHPVFGPQRIRQPHRGRLLPSAQGGIGRSDNEIGLAGVTVKHHGSPPFEDSLRLTDERSVRGTPKAWIAPSLTHITPSGRIHMEVFKAHQAGVLVAEKQLAKDIQKAEDNKKTMAEAYKEKFPELDALAAKGDNLPVIEKGQLLTRLDEDEGGR